MSKFPKKLTIQATDRWFGYDHLAVKECFYSDHKMEPLEYGTTAEYVLTEELDSLRKERDSARMRMDAAFYTAPDTLKSGIATQILGHELDLAKQEVQQYRDGLNHLRSKLQVAKETLELIAGPSEFNCEIGEANQRAAAIKALRALKE